MPDLQIKDGKVVYLDDSSPANTVYKLPEADGTTAQVIKTDGSGNLSFGDVSGTISISGSYGNSIIVNSDEDGGVSTNILHVDVANTRIGINDTTPSYSLDVNGTFRTTGNSILGDASGDSVTINAATIALANVAAGTDNTVLVYNGSSVVTDEIDSRVWGSTLVDGSGTANNVTKWSDSNTVTDSLITDDGSTVTVGGNLTVNGTTTTVNTTNTTITDNLLELNSGASSNSNDSGIIIERGSTGDNGLFIWDESADKFALGTTTATASSTGNITYTDAGLKVGTLDVSGDANFDSGTLFVDVSTNRVGIGTTSPGVTLDVSGEFRVNGGGSGSIVVNDEDSSLCPTMTFLRNGGGTTTNDFIKFENSGGEVAAINAVGGGYFSGDVGIGTTSPSEKLEVVGNAILDATDANLKIKAGGAGTTGAVYYTFNTDSTIYGRLDLPYDTRGSVGLRLKSASSYPITIDAGNGIVFQEDGSTKAGFSNVGDFFVDTDTLFVDESTDRVGINTSSPTDALHVVGVGKVTSAVLTPLLKSGNASGNVTLQGGNSGGANIELYGETHASYANDAYYDADVHNFRSVSAATGYATFAAAEIDFTRNLNMNNYNITGVNSLSIQDPGPDEGITWSGGNGWSIYESPDDLTTNSAGNLQFVDSGSRIFTLNTSGDGDFTGNLSVDGTIKGAAGSNSGDAFLIGNDSKLVDINVANIAGLQGTSNSAEGGLKLGSSGPTIYGKSSNLGIGTTSPSVPLQVDATGEDGIVLRNDGANNITPLIEVRGQRSDTNNSQACGGGLGLTRWAPNNQIVDTNTVGSIYFGGAHGATTADEANILYTASIKAEADETWSSSTDMATDLVFRTGSTGRAYAYNLNYGDSEVMRITHEARVGIGTSTPTYKLDINDDAATGAGLRVTGGGAGAAIARFERDVGSSGCFVDISCSSGDPQIRFTESSGVDWAIGVEGNVFEIVDGNSLTGSSKFEVDSSGNATAAGNLGATGGTVSAGFPDVTQGILYIYGGATGGEGGEIRLYNNADDDSTYDYWRVDSDGAGQFRIGRAGTTDLTVNQSGNFGIGTTSAGDKLEVGGDITLDATDANIKLKSGVTGTTGALYYTFNTDSTIYGRLDLPYDTRESMGLRMKSASGYPITIDSGNGINFAEDGTEFAEFTSAGHFYHNLTGTGGFPGLQNDTHGLMSEDQGSNGNTIHVSRKGNVAASFARNSNSASVVNFYSTAAGGTSAASLAGSIDIDSATTVSIQNASDYRLKENIVSVTDGIERLKQMPVYRFNFTHDADRVVDGFLAHEVQPIVPEAVKGEKDGMKEEEFLVSPEVLDEEGQVVTEAVMGTRTVEKYQTMDQSKLVPLLTAALQEAITKIEENAAEIATLKTQVAALTSNSPE
jgi:hypothetical protein